MKKSLLFIYFITAILITGCSSTVVYRVNPNSPPKMSIEEARDALELTLSIAEKGINVKSFTLEDDKLKVVSSEGKGVKYYYKIFGFEAIPEEVLKEGNDFVIKPNTIMGTGNPSQALALGSGANCYFKSEKDAQLFVDAAYVLKKAQSANKYKYKDMAGKNESADKTTIAVNRQKTSPQPSPDKNAPIINITSPDITRNISVVPKQKVITVIGFVESKGGVFDVEVNGQQAELDAKGNFSANIWLKVGSNEITVKATDLKKNQSVKTFAVDRESGHVASAKTAAVEQTSDTISTAKYYALIVAVQNYENPKITKLDYPVSDAGILMETLTKYYTFEKENIKFLQNPDRRTIYKTLQEIKYKLTTKDNLLIFYAGHGYWMNDMKEGFWLPRDAADVNDPSDWIPNSTIRNYIKSIKAKHILLIADACFSGGIFKTRDVNSQQNTSMEMIYELPSRKAITSGALKTVPDRSVFAEYLLKRLNENREKYLDTQKLFTSLREAVINNSPGNQTPLYGAISEVGDEGGDFVFIKRP